MPDRVWETSNTSGTGAFALLGALTQYNPVSVIGNGNTCYYYAGDVVGANWEIGLGTYASSGNTLARTTVIRSSNANALVNFTSGNLIIQAIIPGEKLVYLDATGNIVLSNPVPVPSGGTGLTTIPTGSVILGNGAFAVNTVAAGTLGNVLMDNGTTWISSSLSNTTPPTYTGSDLTIIGGGNASTSNWGNIAINCGGAV